ncbi:MAG TPA: SdrD B-like domain-containing protein, partial [Planctomycetaceae bacterium]
MLVSAFAAWKRRLAGTEKQRPRMSVRRKSRPAARGGAAVERLEDRTLLAAVGADNLLVITDTASAPFVIAEYTRAGQFVQSFASQRPGGWPSGEVARDVAVTADGKIHVFNGSAAPYLSTLDPVTETWTHTPFPGWSSDGAPGAGGLGVIGNYVFASDSFTSDNSAGIVRFDTVTREAVRFGAVGIRDLSVGLDGLIYTLDAVDSRVVRAWDPETMAQVKQVTLSFTDIRGIATDAAGNLYAAQWDGTVVKIGAGGTTAVDRLLVGANLTDIEIASDGTVIVGAYDGDIHVTDAATLSTPLRIPHGGTTAYVAFSSPQFTSPPPAGISGAAFADANGNGLRDASERGLSGVTVYLDLDRDGALDPGEPTQVTGADGSYLFGVEPGEYVVRQVVHPGYEQTGPADFYYATSRGSSNLSAELLKIDAATGTVTSVGLTGNVVLHGLVRTNDGRLFGINGFNNSNDLFYSVDPTTGRATLIGSVGADLAWGLAYDAATDTIYGIGNVANSGYNRLGTFDRATGAFTPIPGGNGLSVNSLNGTAGIAFEPTRREFVVYEFGDGQTWRFTLDGTAWQLPQNTPNLGLNLAFDGSRFVMKRSFNGADFDLITLDPYAGTWAKIGTVSNGFIAESLEFVNADGFSQVVSVG